MRPEPTLRDLVGLARRMVLRSNPKTAGLWPRAAALLARQALEMTLQRELAALHPALTSCPTRVQLLCLAGLAGDRGELSRVAHLWGALSDACHHHAYETGPVGHELESWLRAVEKLAGHSEPGGGE